MDKRGNEVTTETIDAWITAEIPLGYILVSEDIMHGAMDHVAKKTGIVHV